MHHRLPKGWALPWLFLVASIACGVVSVYALRANNLHMVQLRDAVYTADQNNGDVEKALRDLRTYVWSHMNTSLTGGQNAVYPPIQLKYTYERKLQQLSESASNSNSEIYSQAQQYCERAIPSGFSGSYRLSCIQGFIKEHAPTSIEVVPKNLYQFDFVAAKWSPDKAGWSLLAAGFFFVCAIVTWIIRFIKRHFIRSKELN